ncbi:MAG TPA: glycosyltransferase family 1 protein [Candidatus Peribacteraceae bacterium]|nr:glycosyltransferase family 1 protein [Candidatus Peribacteraceae bacterium]
MHLGIDVREACAEKRTGKGQWTYGFVSELLSRDIDLTLYSDAPLPREWSSRITSCHHLEQIERKGVQWHITAARMIASSSVDAYVSTVSYIVPALLQRTKPMIPIVHDLIAFRHEPHDRMAVFIEKLTLKRAAEHAAMICTVSETTKRDLLVRYPRLDASKVIPIFAGPMAHPLPHEKRTHENIVLCIGTLCPRKNQLRLIDAYSLLPQDLRDRFRLVLVGKRGWHDSDIVSRAQATPGVEWRDYLPDHEVEELMRAAAVFAFPSLYEGFGMPVLDAFLRGIPVLTSAVGSMKEIAGDAALLVDPSDTGAIARGLETLLTDAPVRSALIENGRMRAPEFSWKKTVDRFLEGAESLTKSGR